MKFFSKKHKPKPELKAISRPHETVELASDDELLSLVGSEVVFDVECYFNYFLVSFKFIERKCVCFFELSPISQINIGKLQWISLAYCLIGFNSRNYDLPMLALACTGANTELLKQCSDDIVVNSLNVQAIQQKYNIRIPKINHIDLQEVAPLSESLKKYAARMHAQRLQELPYDPHKVLTREEALNVRDYNLNADLPATILLRRELDEQIKLRISLGQKYNLDLRSRSDAQLAEAIFVSELTKLNGKKPQRPEFDPEASFTYKAPDYVCFATAQLQEILKQITNVSIKLKGNGSPTSEYIENLEVKLDGAIYKMGFGGLHSQEKERCIRSTETVKYKDIDVASFYPRLILNNKFCPEHLGESFLTVFDKIVTMRLDAKKAKDKATDASLKIAINGTFGKLGDIYSYLYSLTLMSQTTITGQLTLLMLIEALVLNNFKVMSANTDGIVVECPQERAETLSAIVKSWEAHCRLETEEVVYRSIHQRDVNNYIAITEDGKVKFKGCYSDKGSAGNSRLSKDPTALICNDAAIAYLTKNVPLEETITTCRDFTRFVVVRAAKGGAQKNHIYLGKVVRWYYALNEFGAIYYVNSGNKVANSEGGKPCMDLPPSFPDDIDYSVYIAKAYDILYDTGTIKRPGELF